MLAWRKSREYFYWRTQRRLAELQLRNKFVEADLALTFEQVSARRAQQAGHLRFRV